VAYLLSSFLLARDDAPPGAGDGARLSSPTCSRADGVTSTAATRGPAETAGVAVGIDDFGHGLSGRSTPSSSGGG